MPLEFLMACNLKDIKDLIYFKDQYLNTVTFSEDFKVIWTLKNIKGFKKIKYFIDHKNFKTLKTLNIQ